MSGFGQQVWQLATSIWTALLAMPWQACAGLVIAIGVLGAVLMRTIGASQGAGRMTAGLLCAIGGVVTTMLLIRIIIALLAGLGLIPLIPGATI